MTKPPPLLGAPSRDPKDISAKVIAVAKNLFLEKDFDKVGIRDIAKKAGVFPVEIYRLGLDKQSILALIAIEIGKQQLIGIRDFLRNSPPEGTLLEKVKAFLLFLYKLDIAILPIRSQSAAHGWFWGKKYEDEIVCQVYQFLEPVERWMIEEGLDEVRDRCMLIWSLYYVGFRAAVMRGGSAQDCLQGIERPLALALIGKSNPPPRQKRGRIKAGQVSQTSPLTSQKKSC